MVNTKVKEIIVVGSKTRDVVKEAEMNMGGDFAQALSDRTRQLIEDATRRAKDNGRKTVRASDL